MQRNNHEYLTGGAARILVVEDCPELAELISDIGTKHGADVYVAETCGLAARCLAMSTYDWIIIDYTMPDGSGLDILKVVWVPEETRLVLFSAKADCASVKKEAEAVGVERVFIKPEGFMELIEHIFATTPNKEQKPIGDGYECNRCQSGQ